MKLHSVLLKTYFVNFLAFCELLRDPEKTTSTPASTAPPSIHLLTPATHLSHTPRQQFTRYSTAHNNTNSFPTRYHYVDAHNYNDVIIDYSTEDDSRRAGFDCKITLLFLF
ncbi:hypothetical protein HELRODRAFT_171811 [Helobdella robusta]|uniref:Uncharacterized protein n=1 Tax=Helobdella robusta TaxID=6412 RepID=T1F4Q2_HELRO|nr:hypothetical protein HELRODRAFT_171811 [Helobdella robusta]ESO05412.1 hypothetical protein HELRODRAFT_171811 [Helobdella robusta]